MTAALDSAAVDAEVERRLLMKYTRGLIRNDDGTWFAHVLEFPGCMTEGETQVEALEMLDDAMRGWLEVKIEDGDAIPEPYENDYAGRILVRVASSLHRDLVRRAQREGVSLNTWITTLLARGM